MKEGEREEKRGGGDREEGEREGNREIEKVREREIESGIERTQREGASCTKSSTERISCLLSSS